jgi:fructose-bisphosphate aldolase class I
MKLGKGFIAALDQSGGSTPKALKLYGLDASSYSSESEMFDRVHEMRTRIIKSPAFDGDRILGVILFQMTMERMIDGMGSAEYLWKRKKIVPFLKVDIGLETESDGVQLMKPIPGLGDRLLHAKDHGIFGTKMRSVIGKANRIGINAIVDQQFDFARQILELELVPIIEPEIDINCPQKKAAEELLKVSLLSQLDRLRSEEIVMLKLTLPEEPGFYSDLVEHPQVLRVVALSGGYSRDYANELLAKNPNVIASFSRALTEGLSAGQSEAEFNETLNASIESIYEASIT